MFEEVVERFRLVAVQRSEIAKLESVLWRDLSESMVKILQEIATAAGLQRDKLAEERGSQGYLTTAQTVMYLGVSRTTLYRLRHDGVLPFIKIGRSTRFKREDLDSLASKMNFKST